MTKTSSAARSDAAAESIGMMALFLGSEAPASATASAPIDVGKQTIKIVHMTPSFRSSASASALRARAQWRTLNVHALSIEI